jgi:WD40 repeat protein
VRHFMPLQSFSAPFREFSSNVRYVVGVCFLLNTVQAFQVSPTEVFAIARQGEHSQRRSDLYGDPLPRGAVARMGTLRFWTGAPISSIAFAPDSKSVAAASMGFSGRIPVWEAMSGRLLRTVPAPGEALPDDFSGIRRVVFSPEGSMLAACGDVTIVVGQPTSGRIVRVLRGQQGGIFELAFASNGKRLISTGGDQTLRVWDLDTSDEIRRFPLSGQVMGSIALSPDGATLASGFPDGTTRLWDVLTGEFSRCFAGETLICFCAFSANGRTITSLSTGGVFRTWELGGIKEIHSVRLDGWNVGAGFAVSPDLKMIAAISHEASLAIWEAATGKQVRRIQFEPWNNIRVITFSPDSKSIASDSGDGGVVRLWDIASGTEKAAYARHRAAVRSLAFLSEDTIVASAGEDATIRLWDVATGKQVFSVLDDSRRIWNSRATREESPEVLFERTGPTGDISASDDGKMVVSAYRDGTLTSWDATRGVAVRRVRLDCSGQISEVAFAPNGKTIVASDTGNGTLGLWDLTNGRNIHRVAVDKGGIIRSLAFASEGDVIATGSDDGTVTLWETNTFRLLRRLRVSQGSIQCVAFSADGKMICVGGVDAILRIWTLETGELQRLTDHADPEEHVIRSVAFSPDGKRVAWAADDRVVRIWDMRKGEATAQYPGHVGQINRLVFSRNSNRIASASDDGTILVWEVSENAH